MAGEGRRGSPPLHIGLAGALIFHGEIRKIFTGSPAYLHYQIYPNYWNRQAWANTQMENVYCLPVSQHFNSFPTSGDFSRLMITFANSLDPDQVRQNVGPDLDPNCLTV